MRAAMLTGTVSSAATQSTRRRLPAYGRKIITLRKGGQAPTSAVLVADGWRPIDNLEKYAPWVVVVPEDERPEEMDFGFLNGLFAFVFAATVKRMDDIACAVLADEPAGVFGWAEDHPTLACYDRGLQ
jgi:hypothetical protein